MFQKELDNVACVWNTHRIRASRNTNSPHGRPDVLFSLPEAFNTRDYSKNVDHENLELCRQQCIFREGIPTADSEMFELLTLYMSERDIPPPKTAENGLQLYTLLRNQVYNDL